jgi:hypothetical protein
VEGSTFNLSTATADIGKFESCQQAVYNCVDDSNKMSQGTKIRFTALSLTFLNLIMRGDRQVILSVQGGMYQLLELKAMTSIP